MTITARVLLGLLYATFLFLGGILLLHLGIYGWTVFAVLPLVLGSIPVWILRPGTAGVAAIWGALVVIAAGFLLMAGNQEGLLCVLMALPLTASLGALGGLLAYYSMGRQSRNFAMLLLLTPATFVWDAKAPPPVFAVRTAIEIAAAPEVVWKNVIAFSEMPEPEEWYFRAGVAYPERARIAGRGVGAVRYCDFSTGPFVEPIEVWDEPRLLRFRVVKNPAPLREWSFYGPLEPKHLHGYFISKQGQFRLIPLANGHTLLEGATWYQHGLWPSAYWLWWSDAIIHRIHLRVLEHIRWLSEQENRG